MFRVILALLLLLIVTTTTTGQTSCNNCNVTCPNYNYTNSPVTGPKLYPKLVNGCVVWHYVNNNQPVPEGRTIDLNGQDLQSILAKYALVAKAQPSGHSYVMRDGVKVYEGVASAFKDLQTGDEVVQKGNISFVIVLKPGSARYYQSEKEYLAALDSTKQAASQFVNSKK